MSSEESDKSEDLSSSEGCIQGEEVTSLRRSNYMDTLSVSGAESGTALCEDTHSRIYVDFDDERLAPGPWEVVEGCDSHDQSEPVSLQELLERAAVQRSGGLPN